MPLFIKRLRIKSNSKPISFTKYASKHEAIDAYNVCLFHLNRKNSFL